MYIPLRLGLRLQDMFILLALGAVFVGLAYLADVVKTELKGGSYERTNFSPWTTPQFYLLTAAAGIALASLNSGSRDTLDVQLHDTYFVVAAEQAGLIMGSYFVLIAFVYFVARNLELSPWITTIHLVLTLGCSLLGYYLFSATVPEGGTTTFVTSSNLSVRVVLLFLFAQLLLPINLFVGLAKRWFQE